MTRSLQVLNLASVCENMSALRDPNVNTVEQVKAVPDQRCPLFDECNAGKLLGPTLRNCAPRMGMDVARYAAQAHRPIAREMDDFRYAGIYPPLGYLDPYDKPDRDALITDRAEINERVQKWAETLTNGDPQHARDERCICPVLQPTPGGCPVHGG
jgi:hypothetical protein